MTPTMELACVEAWVVFGLSASSLAEAVPTTASDAPAAKTAAAATRAMLARVLGLAMYPLPPVAVRW